tara:strand:+ start:3894 stop:4292 length:399 start_codon:yes stop_codon:yes gene_type:complete
MSIRRLIFTTALVCACSGAALAQTVRAPAPTPGQQGVRAPDLDPTQQSIAALSLKVDALSQAVGRQIIVLEQVEQTATLWPASSDTFPNNNTRSTALCEQALGDRFGRAISRDRQTVGERYFLSRVVCETRP